MIFWIMLFLIIPRRAHILDNAIVSSGRVNKRMWDVMTIVPKIQDPLFFPTLLAKGNLFDKSWSWKLPDRFETSSLFYPFLLLESRTLIISDYPRFSLPIGQISQKSGEKCTNQRPCAARCFSDEVTKRLWGVRVGLMHKWNRFTWHTSPQ